MLALSSTMQAHEKISSVFNGQSQQHENPGCSVWTVICTFFTEICESSGKERKIEEGVGLSGETCSNMVLCATEGYVPMPYHGLLLHPDSLLIRQPENY